MIQSVYYKELAIVFFLVSLDSSINSQIKGLILSETHLLTLGDTFFIASSISIEVMPTLATLSSIEPTTLLSSSPPGMGRGFDGGCGPSCDGQGHGW